MFAPQQQQPDNHFQCIICLEPYNSTDHKPRIFPNCGHTIGEKCLSNLFQFPSCKCPFDKKPCFSSHGSLKLSNFPINYQIIGLIEEGLRWERCSHANHNNEELKLICLDCKQKACVYCIIDTHKNHNVKPLHELKPQVADKIDQLEKGLQKLTSCNAEIDSKIEEARLKSHIQMEDMFMQFRFMMQAKSVELAHQINSIFDLQKKRISQKIGSDCSLKLDIAEKLSSYKNLTSSPDPLSLIDQDISDYMLNIDESLSHATLENISQGLKELPELIGKKFEAFTRSVTEMSLPVNELTREESEDESDSLMFLSPLKMVTSLGVAIKEEDKKKYLEIRIKQRDEKTQILSPETLEELKEIDSLKVIFSQDINEVVNGGDLQMLCFLLSKMKGVQALSIEAERLEFVEKELERLLAHLLYNPQDCIKFSINLSKGLVGSRALIFLAEKCLAKMVNLKDLDLDVSGLKVSERSLGALVKSVKSLNANLETLQLSFNETSITKNNLMDFLSTPAPKLTELKLHVSCTDFENQCVKELVQKILVPSANSLKVLDLKLRKTLITDEGALELFNNIPMALEVLRLDFSHVKISDASMGNLAYSKLPGMQALKSGEIFVNYTKVSRNAEYKFIQSLREKIAQNRPAIYDEIFSDVDNDFDNDY